MSLTELEHNVWARLLEEAIGEFGPTPLARLQRAVRAASDGLPLSPADPNQAPGSLYIPDLTARPWWDAATIPAVPVLEQAAGIFRQELDALLQRQTGFQHFDEGPEGFEAADSQFGWNAFYFRWNCRDVSRNQALCPQSSAVLRSVPDLAQQAWFSALKPGTHLEAHCGPTNAVLTVHLGMIIPPGCEMRVGFESRGWLPGKCLVFEDSFEHEVWHRGDQTRIILLLDVWHPELTPIERTVFQRATLAIEENNEKAGYASAVDRYKDTLDGKDWWK